MIKLWPKINPNLTILEEVDIVVSRLYFVIAVMFVVILLWYRLS